MLTKSTWKELPFSGIPDRSLHTSTLFKHYIITYGGYSFKKEHHVKEIIEIFNLETGELEKFNLKGDEPQPVQRHSACLFDSNKILIFGGFYKQQVLNNVSVITIEETSPELTLTYEKMITTGGDKFVTCSHTANVYKNKMYVFGGRISNDPLKNTNELWSLDLENFHWERCETSGHKPEARTTHYSAIYNDKLYIFGGFHDRTRHLAKECSMISLETLRWEKLRTKSFGLFSRVSPSAAVIGDHMFVMGGHHKIADKESRVLRYNFKNNTIQNVTSKGKYSDSRFATAVGYQNRIVLWGGLAVGDTFVQLSCLRIGLFYLLLRSYSHIDNLYQGGEPLLPLASLLNSEQYSDIRFSIEGSTIPAHKVVLGMRCKYFNDMFSSGMKESQAQVLEITDVKIETFKAFLKFLYQNEVDFTEPLAMDLYILADKYMQNELAELCENFLADNVDLHNSVEMEKFAEMYGAELLRKTASEFAQNNTSLEIPNPDFDLSGFFSTEDEISQVALEQDSL